MTAPSDVATEPDALPRQAIDQPARAAANLTRVANFDRLARPYRWLEYLTFGPLLSRCRMQYLGQMSQASRVLVLGDGDGRFLERLLRSNPTVIADVVDSSAGMLRRSRRRIIPFINRADLRHCDALHFAASLAEAEMQGFGGSGRGYDLVVTHFFLDCLSSAEIEELVDAIKPHLRADATWVVSEFAVPSSGIRGCLARLLIGALYRIFGLLTGLRARTLPDYPAVFAAHGLGRIASRSRLGGLLISELWSL